MIDKLLNPEVQEFIRQHENADEQQLLLKHKSVFGVPTRIIAWQISGRRKAKSKLPLFSGTELILYPPGLNLEQSSSEETARFKAFLLNKILSSKNLLVDLTGGFGVDSFFLSKIGKQVLYIDPNIDLMAYAKHNHKTLGADNVSYNNITAEEFFNNRSDSVDCFFIDPSRRTTGNQKVFRLADCEPDIVQLQAKIFSRSKNLLVKTSPMLDVQLGISELKFVKTVWVVAVDNEMKEILFLCEDGYTEEPPVIAIDLTKESESLLFNFSEERNLSVQLSNPLQYLYEPNAALLKAGAFKTVAAKFSLKKLHISTHLYTGNQKLENFPGRIFEVDRLLKAEPKAAAEFFTDGKANIITRNYPLSPDELKKKLKLKDGGRQYLIGCSGEQEKFLIAATRLK